MGPSPSVAVCLPAHDEAEHIGRVLASLAAQEGFGPDRRLTVLVFVNNCSDDTAGIANAFARSEAGASLDLQVPIAELRPEDAHVGFARRAAMDLSAARLGQDDDGVLITTDADARLPPRWVEANVAALRGAEIVGGRLIVDQGSPNPEMTALHKAIEAYWAWVREVEEELDPQPHDPAPRHGDHTGASLALRVSTYRAVGGLPPLPRGEDNALVSRVVEAGGRLRHDPDVSVHVSDRVVGRASGGMASEMSRRRAVLAGQDSYLVPAPSHWRRIVTRRADLRRAWRSGPQAAMAALSGLGLPDEAISRIGVGTCPNAIAFVERAHACLARQDDPAPLVTLEEALHGFDARLTST